MKKSLFFIFFLLPFLPVFSFLKTEDINYSAYFSIVILIFAASLLLYRRNIKIDINLRYWIWYIFVTFISWPISFILKNYGYLTYPFTAVSLYIILKYYTNHSDYLFFLKLFFIAAFIEAVLGISQSLLGFPLFENITKNIYESDRNYLAYIFPSIRAFIRQGTGTFEHFNGLASYLALSIPIIYGYWKSNKNKTRLILLLVVAFGLIITFSRGSLIGTLVGVYFVFLIKSKRKSTLITFTGIGIIILAMLLSSILVNYYQSTQNFTIREYTWAFALSEALNQPIKLIYGFGPFYFHEKFLGMAGTISNLHSGQLQILLEEGLIGFMLFIMLFISTIKKAIRYKENIAIVSITGGLIAFFSSQLFDNAYFGYTGILWFSLLAIVFTIKDENIFIIKKHKINDIYHHPRT